MNLRRTRVAMLAVAVLAALSVPLTAPTSDAAPSPIPVDLKRLPAPQRTSEATEATFDPHSVLVRFKRGASAAARSGAVTDRGARVSGPVAGTRFVKVETDGSLADLMRALAKDPSVAEVALDYRRRLSATPNDPLYATYQTYLKTVRLPQAWDRIRDASTQVIAVVDTGVDVNHPDLIGRTVTGYNALTNSSSVTDQLGHGTMVAGIAAANTNNGVGVAGAAWKGRILPVKVFQSNGYALDSDVAEGIVWAADHGAKVINLSLGGPGQSTPMHDAIVYVTGKGALVVAAGGNTGDSTPQYPAAFPEVLSVGATDAAGALTDFSTWGDWIDVAAPGFDIASTYPTASGFAYAAGAGTSFSAPIVSGVAALVRAKNPTWTPAQVHARLRATARDAGPRGIDPYYGYGLLDAYYAVGGTWGAELGQRSMGTGEPNDAPARAISLSTSATGTMAMEGDVDWYRYVAGATASVTAKVTPAVYDEARAQNFDPMLAVYDGQLRLLGKVDNGFPGDPEQLNVTVVAGTYYIAVRNYNGAPDLRSYGVTVTVSSPGVVTTAGEQWWVRSFTPTDFSTGISRGVTPKVTFQRALDATSVTSSTVKLVRGKTGSTVTTARSYDAASKTVTLTPATPLQDNTPYRIVVGAVRDLDGATHGKFTSTFRTVNETPPPVTSAVATGGYQSATLTWALPAITDLDKVIIRMAEGMTAPPSPTSGTGVYAGTGTTVTVSGLTGTGYTFAIWVQDRTGKLSTVVTRRLIGTKTTISAPTSVKAGTTVTVTATLRRRSDDTPIAGATMRLYARKKGTSTWTLLTTATTSSTGKVSYSHKPSASWEYSWRYNGSTTYIGSRATVSVTVS